MTIASILAQFDDFRYSVATFGSDSKSERGVLIIDGLGTFERIADSARAFSSRLASAQLDDHCRLIVRHSHRAYVQSPNYALHLLFYPSIQHLTEWELPSFLTYIYLNAKVETGSVSFLQPFANAYARRELLGSVRDLMFKQQVLYDKIAVESLLYTVRRSNVYGRNVSTEDLGYVTRFTLAEYYLASGLGVASAGFWSWESVIELTREHFPSRSPIIEILTRSARHESFRDDEELLAYFLEYLSMRDELLERVRRGTRYGC